jgi:two-component system LytT family response regulator
MRPHTIKAIAVDDEQHCIDTLRWELERHCPQVELINTFLKGEEALEVLQQLEFDILFLDIHLQTMTGLDLLEQLMPVDFEVVFVTAYDEYAVKAFDLAATHYLLKPINGIKLKAAVDRMQGEHIDVLSPEAMTSLISSIKSSMNNLNRVPFSVLSGVEFINPEDIIYVEGENNYSILHLTNRKNLVVSKTLAHTEKLLTEFSFVRIHKSYLVNLRYLKRYVKQDGGYVVLENGKQLAVSRMRKHILNALFK